MVLVQKWPFFRLFFKAIQARKMSFKIFQDEKTPFWAIRTRRSKTAKMDIFPMGFTHSFGRKKAIFPSFFLKVIQARKMSFTIFQSEKTTFQAIKTRSLKSPKTDMFPNPWFWSKNDNFLNFYFQAIQVRRMFLKILQNEKTPFQAIKKRSSKSPKLDIYPKGLTHGFGPKVAFFPTFFLRQYRAEKCLLRYSRRKKRLSRV